MSDPKEKLEGTINVPKSFDTLETYLLEDSVIKEPDLPWMASFGNDRSVYVRVRTPPPWFYRKMQRWLLGIKWEKHDD